MHAPGEHARASWEELQEVKNRPEVVPKKPRTRPEEENRRRWRSSPGGEGRYLVLVQAEAWGGPPAGLSLVLVLVLVAASR